MTGDDPAAGPAPPEHPSRVRFFEDLARVTRKLEQDEQEPPASDEPGRDSERP